MKRFLIVAILSLSILSVSASGYASVAATQKQKAPPDFVQVEQPINLFTIPVFAYENTYQFAGEVNADFAVASFVVLAKADCPYTLMNADTIALFDASDQRCYSCHSCKLSTITSNAIPADPWKRPDKLLSASRVLTQKAISERSGVWKYLNVQRYYSCQVRAFNGAKSL